MLGKWEELIALRQRNGLSLEALSSMCGLSQEELFRLENGLEEVNELQLEAISEALNVSPLALLGIETISESSPVEARLRTQGDLDLDLKKAINFGLDFINKIEELKYLDSLG
ncbi:helix-turn-helix domain-containing protein [Saccharococcus caldoxylosilyticus]|uniref:helix-turn-helix domain-containing protein n=1 Tax=Saccharococcus caldoxylosilyticus TaxID=81408 RepID=UPI000371F924|nr:helix-turn-helix transcriptional regulator [Parageobacillus caldoxylosilyticus]